MHPAAVSRQGVLLASDLRRLGYDARGLQRAAARGVLHRLLRGAYVDDDTWTGASAAERHILRLRAIEGTRAARPVFSHLSAAALHGLPILGAWPFAGHVSADVPGRSRNGVAFHRAIAGRTPTEVRGLACTSLLDTLVDLARTSSFTSATISIDHALQAVAVEARGQRRVTLASPVPSNAAHELTDELVDALLGLTTDRNAQKALKALRFATHLADSPGESLSRCSIHLLGFPPPELQQEFYDQQGFIGRGDFWWPHIGLLGEFDGEDKYKNPAYLNGRTPQQALVDEKWREDRIRATGASVSRWGWKTAIDSKLLYAQLFAAGLRTVDGR